MDDRSAGTAPPAGDPAVPVWGRSPGESTAFPGPSTVGPSPARPAASRPGTTAAPGASVAPAAPPSPWRPVDAPTTATPVVPSPADPPRVPVVASTTSPSGLPAAPPAPGRAGRGGVGVLAIVLLLAAAVVVVPAVTALWVRSTARSSSAWQDALGPLHDDPDVTGPLAEDITDRLQDETDVDIREADVADVIASSSFDQAWRDAVGEAHGQSVAMLDGERTEEVYLPLGELAAALEDEGIPVQDVDDTDVVVIEGRYADQVRDSGRLMDRMALILPVAALLLGAAGFAAARNRLRAAAILGVAITVLAGVSLLVTLTVPGAIADAVATDDVREPVGAVTDALTSRLLVMLVIVAVVGLVLAVGALVGERVKRSNQPPPVAWPGA